MGNGLFVSPDLEGTWFSRSSVLLVLTSAVIGRWDDINGHRQVLHGQIQFDQLSSVLLRRVLNFAFGGYNITPLSLFPNHSNCTGRIIQHRSNRNTIMMTYSFCIYIS